MSTHVGTPPYMSPEFFDETDHFYSSKVDVWALNTCLYYLLTKQFYFYHIQRDVLKQMVLTRAFEVPPEVKISAPTQRLLAKGYIKAAKARPSIIEYLLDPAFDSFREKYTNILTKYFT